MQLKRYHLAVLILAAIAVLCSTGCGTGKALSLDNLPTPEQIEGVEKKGYVIGGKLWKISATVLSDECMQGDASDNECLLWEVQVETYRHDALCFHQLFLAGENTEQNCGQPSKLALYRQMYKAVSALFLDAVRHVTEEVR